MKKMFLGVLAAVIVLSAGAGTALAAGSACGGGFLDADGDGICDNCGTYHLRSMTGTGRGGNFVDADGDGVCDHYAPGQGGGACGGHGENFVDADGDGACDYYASGLGRGCGRGFQGGCGNGFRSGRGK